MISDVHRLRTLRRIALHGSFSRAAEELGYTQSAVSQQISALEHEVGLTLLNRGVRPVVLTDAGEVLVTHADRVLEHIATAEAQLDALRGLRAGRVRLAAFGSAFATFLPAALARFRARHPAVELQLTAAEPDAALALLRSGEVALAIVYDAERAATADGFVHTHLLDDEHRAVLPAGHRLARRNAVAVSDLSGDAWIVPPGDGPARAYRAAVERLCADAGFAPRVAFETDDLQAAQAFVAAGLGVALMHDLTLPTRRDGVAVRPLKGSRLTRPVSAITVAGRHSPAAVAMLEALGGPGSATPEGQRISISP